jgi:membrane protease YdiL (CAAX protease family)
MKSILGKILIPSFSIFIAWVILRFILMTKVRSFFFHNFSFDAAEKILLNHFFIVLEGFILFIVYYFFRRNKKIDGFNVCGRNKNSIKIGIAVGVLIFLTTIPVGLYFGMKISPYFNLVNGLSNLFSNAAEEVIYRGIIFVAVLSLFRPTWISIVISGVAFGLGHWDLPYLFQAYIAVVGAILALTYVKTKSLVAPYIAHMIADLLADSFLQ